MIAQNEQQHVFELALQPGWDIVLREVMEKVNSTGQDALATLRPDVSNDERVHRGGMHQGVHDIFEFLKKMEKDAHSYVVARDKESSRPLQAQ